MIQAVTPLGEPQSAGAVLMVRPARFAYNPQTAASNAFQAASPAGLAAAQTPWRAQAAALREFDDLADKLQAAGILVRVVDDTATPVKPDAVFPNNWVSFHRDGTVVLYPMLARNRRVERRADVVQLLVREGGYAAPRIVDLSYREAEGKFLEGTGSVVLDRANRLAYACVSPRTDLDVLGEFAERLDYEPVTFEAFGESKPVYHTNVLMAIGTRFAVLCAAAIPDPVQRGAVAEKLRATGHDLIEITRDQMRQFAGNLLELAPESGPLIALSSTAWRSLEATQRRALERHGSVVAADIPVIEGLGGGGVRCMLAEIHLPRRSQNPAVP